MYPHSYRRGGVDAILTDLAKPDPGPGGRTLMHALRGELGKRQLETKN